MLFPLYCFWRPSVEEAQYFLLAVSLSFLQERAVLNVDYVAFLIQNHHYRITEASRIAKAFQQFCRCFPARIVYMYVDIIVRNDLCHSRVLLYEIGKAQTPRTPIATYLTDNVFPRLSGFLRCLSAPLGQWFRHKLSSPAHHHSVRMPQASMRIKDIFS